MDIRGFKEFRQKLDDLTYFILEDKSQMKEKDYMKLLIDK